MAPAEPTVLAQPASPWVTRLVDFVRQARHNGFRLGIQEEIEALSIAERVNISNQQRLRWGLRSLMCCDREDWQRFDELFDRYWLPSNRQSMTESPNRGRIDRGAGLARLASGDAERTADQAEDGNDPEAHDGGTREGASHRELNERSDFRQLQDEGQMQEMERLVERLARRIRRRLTRRQKVKRLGQRIHLRRTIRASLRYGGTPLDLVYRQRRRDRPRLLLLLDVSRSMSFYSYLFLRFARGILRSFKDADAFVYHTRLVHVSEALTGHNLDAMRTRLAVLSAGWSGGTRIGDSLRAFNRDYGRRTVNGRTIVVIVSDGYDTGEPETLSTEMASLKSRARAVVWLNPLLGREGYQPVAKGMQAALPFVDLFAPANNLQSLAALEPRLAAL
jgi:uncharacterized protein with von Willebrand factor type A (vWA) domain